VNPVSGDPAGWTRAGFRTLGAGCRIYDCIDVSAHPYWEVVNNHLCFQLKNDYPLQAISCLMQVAGSENPHPGDDPGGRSSIETIGDIDPLVLPSPVIA
jgi:hypothetical protein